MASSSMEGRAHKRPRLDLDDGQLRKVGFSDAEIVMWHWDRLAVQKLHSDKLLEWVDVVLRVGMTPTDIIEIVLRAFRDNGVTGVSLMLMDLRELVPALGPRHLLQDRIGDPQLVAAGPGSTVAAEVVHREDPLADIVLPASTALLKGSVLRAWDGQQRKLVDRDTPHQIISDYVEAVVLDKASKEITDLYTSQLKARGSGPESVDRKGWKVCAIVAASGMGKSAFLETVAREQHSTAGRQALFVTFNTKESRVPQRFWPHPGNHIEYCISGALLHAAGATTDHLLLLPSDVRVEDVLRYIRAARKMESTDTLIVCVDELLQVKRKVFRQSFVGVCMRLQDQAAGTLVMLFTAFAGPQISSWVSESGRVLYPVPLKPLNAQLARDALLKEVKDRAAKDPTDAGWGYVARWLTRQASRKIVSVMATHPRGLFEIFVRHAARIRYVSAASMSQLLSSVFGDPALGAFAERAQTAVGPIVEILQRDTWDGTSSHDLVQAGMVVKNDDGKWRPISFLMRAVAFAGGSGPLQDELRAIYTADMGISKQTRVYAQDVVLHFECLLRHVHRDPVRLKSIFRGGTIAKALRRKQYALCPPGATPEILEVRNFEDCARMKADLARGCILLSSRTTEKGVEYLSPLFSPTSGNMTAVLACQVKGGTSVPKVRGEQVPQAEVCPGLLEWARQCAQRIVPSMLVIPVLVMVNSTCPPASGLKAKNSVQILGAAVKDWLQILLPLEMIDMPVDEPPDDYQQG